ncbi:membrane-associated protein, putative [Bodo saltans]|uniref:Membrane-associated protein, putative n=1 Tax=Bodo saltans TaxID=75058 RepID=A0A0S4JFV6_BODSA|nr:membrane-associated protein, putative [Bodo saltans]|eukprot:CUG88070.1 membrane-associated protein, putative [Bodo saltans]
MKTDSVNLQLLFAVFVQIVMLVSSTTNFSNCIDTPDRTTQCIAQAFPGAEQCILMPTWNSSLGINASCFDGSVLSNTTCSRSGWKLLARCLAQTVVVVVADNVTVGGCQPFMSEADCWSRVALVADCTGSLSGVCAAGFGFPKVNCTQLSPTLQQTSMCPIANGLLLCNNCTVEMTLTDQVAVVAANSGLKLVNPHNQMYVFPNVTAYGSDVSSLLEDIATFAYENEVASFLCGNDLPYFAKLVTFMARRYSGSSSKFFVAYLRAPLTASIHSFPNVLFLSGRLDLLAYVAGYTLATASKSKVILYSSHFPTSTFEREFFIGFAGGARDSAENNITILWGTSLPESLAARAALFVDGVSSGSAPQLVYPFLSQPVFGIGTFADYLIDPSTFGGQNTTQSRNLLFSVIGNLNTAIVAQFGAAAVGNFITGLWSGDASAVSVQPCVFSCSNISSTMLGAMRRSFGLVHRLGATTSIDFTTGEFVVARSPLGMTESVNSTGPPLSDLFLTTQPTIVAVNFERIALISLSEPVVSSRVVFYSMAVSHTQPTFLASASTAPQRRVDYATSADPVSGQIFVSMGYDATDSASILGDIWSLPVPRFFQMTATWTNIATASSSPVTPRFGHSMVFYNGTLFVFGGGTVVGGDQTTTLAPLIMHRFDVNSSAWRADGATYTGSSSGRVYHGMVTYSATPTVWGGVNCSAWLIVAGGRVVASDADVLQDDLLFYCPQFDVWHAAQLGTGGGMVGFRQRFCLNILSTSFGNALVIFGGVNSSTVSPTTVLADVSSGGDGLVNVDVVDFEPASGSASCVAVANSAMKLADDWALAVVNTPASTNDVTLSYYWPTPLSCSPFGSSTNTFSRFACTQCPDQAFSDATATRCIACGRTDDSSVNPRCSDDTNTFLIAFTTSLAAAFLIVVIPLATRAVQSFRNLRRMEQSERIGVELAESISSLDFARLHFLSSLKNPTRLQRAFLTILTILVTYLQFMPNWVLAGNRIRPDRRKATTATDRGDAASPRLRSLDPQDSHGVEDDDSLPHRIPRLNNSTSQRQRSGGRQDNVSLAHPSDDDEEDGDNMGDNLPISSLSIEQRVKRLQNKMLEAWVVILYVKISPEVASSWTVRVASTTRPGGVSERPDLDRLNAFSCGLTERADYFGGLIETSMNNRIVISFNGWRCTHDPELAAVRCAASIGLMVDTFRATSTLKIPDDPLSLGGGNNTTAAGGGGQGSGGIHCGIACGFAHVGIIGRRHGQFSAVLGPPMQEAVMYSSVAALYDQRIVLPFLKMKTCLGGKIALRIIGEVTIGGSSTTSSSSRSNDATGSGAFETAISPRALSVSSAGQPERHLLCRVVGKRRSIGAAQLQSLESFNTLMEYVFQGAKAAAETQLLRDGGAGVGREGSPLAHLSSAASSHHKSTILLPEDRMEVEAAIAFGSVPRLDTITRHAPSAPVALTVF